MKKKFLAMSCMVIMAACMVFLSACGGPKVEDLIRQDVDKAFSKVSPNDEELLEAMKASVGDGFDQLGIAPEEFAKAYLEGFDYKIKEVSVDEKAGKADVTVVIKTKSLSAILSDFAAKFQERFAAPDQLAIDSEDELYKQAGQILMESIKDIEPAETDCIFTYEKDDGNTWSTTEDAELKLMEAMQ